MCNELYEKEMHRVSVYTALYCVIKLVWDLKALIARFVYFNH